ncbi:hypothetical protein Pelo_7453 [Pelomyxa schiedti]|nr:hypothetical protein Pelo_7453 [Pelomyxa schiedti]
MVDVAVTTPCRRTRTPCNSSATPMASSSPTSPSAPGSLASRSPPPLSSLRTPSPGGVAARGGGAAPVPIDASSPSSSSPPRRRQQQQPQQTSGGSRSQTQTQPQSRPLLQQQHNQLGATTTTAGRFGRGGGGGASASPPSSSSSASSTPPPRASGLTQSDQFIIPRGLRTTVSANTWSPILRNAKATHSTHDSCEMDNEPFSGDSDDDIPFQLRESTYNTHTTTEPASSIPATNSLESAMLVLSMRLQEQKDRMESTEEKMRLLSLEKQRLLSANESLQESISLLEKDRNMANSKRRSAEENLHRCQASWDIERDVLNKHASDLSLKVTQLKHELKKKDIELEHAKEQLHKLIMDRNTKSARYCEERFQDNESVISTEITLLREANHRLHSDLQVALKKIEELNAARNPEHTVRSPNKETQSTRYISERERQLQEGFSQLEEQRLLMKDAFDALADQRAALQKEKERLCLLRLQYSPALQLSQEQQEEDFAVTTPDDS